MYFFLGWVCNIFLLYRSFEMLLQLLLLSLFLGVMFSVVGSVVNNIRTMLAHITLCLVCGMFTIDSIKCIEHCRTNVVKIVHREKTTYMLKFFVVYSVLDKKILNYELYSLDSQTFFLQKNTKVLRTFCIETSSDPKDFFLQTNFEIQRDFS